MDERDLTDRADGAGQDDGDEDVMGSLAALAGRMDPVPPAVLEGARAAFTWRTIDAELAELAFDSAASDRALSGVRSTVPGPRLLTFETPGIVLELEVSEVGDRRHLVGQLVPPGPADLELRHPRGSTQVSADERGRFTAADIAAGPVSVRVTRRGQEPVVTDWVGL